MERHFVIRVPRKLVFALVPALCLLCVAEVGQRISDWRKERRRAERGADRYAIRAETAGGVPLTRKPGSIVVELHPFLAYRPRPGQRLDGVTINALGFRGAEWPTVKDPSTVRVAVFGGSTAFGQGVSTDDRVLTSVLEERLNREAAPGRRYEVLNAAVIGYTTTQELILFATEVCDRQIDVVVLLDGWNDFYAGGHVPPGDDLVAYMVPFFHRELDQVLALGQQLGRNILRLSAFYRGLERKVARAREAAAAGAGAGGGDFGCFYDNRRALALYRRQLQTLCRLVRATGAAAIVVAQPELFARSLPIPDEERELRERIRAGAGDFKEPGYEAYAVARYPEYVRAAEEVARTEGARFLDGTAVYDDANDAVFVDFVHVNDRGHEILAERVLPLVTAAAADVRRGD